MAYVINCVMLLFVKLVAAVAAAVFDVLVAVENEKNERKRIKAFYGADKYTDTHTTRYIYTYISNTEILPNHH